MDSAPKRRNAYVLSKNSPFMIRADMAMNFDERFENKEQGIIIGKGTKIEPGAVIYNDCIIGKGCIIGTSAVLKQNTRLGDHSIFGTLSSTDGNVRIGSWTTVHSQCYVTWGMEIGDSVFIGPFFYSANTPNISKGRFGYPNSTHDPRVAPIIRNGARIGAHVGLAPGVIIGENTMIDMGCLVTKNVPDNAHVRASSEITGRIIGTFDATIHPPSQ